MDITLKREDGCQKTYEVKAPWEEIAPRFDTVTRTLAGQVRLPGFRGGKAPLPMVRSQFRKAIREEVMEHLLQDAAGETLKKFELKPVVEPYAGTLELEDGKPFSVEITVEVAPEIPEVSAQGLALECPKLDVTEEQILKTLEGIRERAAVMKPIEGAGEEGDFAVVDLHRKGASKGFERFFGVLPKSDNPVEQALLGKKPGEAFELAVAEDHGHEGGEEHGHAHLAAGDYTVTVTKVMRREVPELGEDLAKELGAESLEDLKAKVRGDLEARARSEMRSVQEDKLIEGLAAKYPFPVPPTQVDRQIQSDLEDFAESLSRQGLDLNHAKLDWGKMAESRRPIAAKKVAAYYLLDAVARQKDLTATDAEVDDYFARQAQGSRLSPDALKAQAAKDDRLGIVKAIIAHRKAADLLLSQASVTFTEGKTPTQEAP
jgi:trigger factor